MAQSKVFVVQRNICETMGIEIVQNTAKKISGGCMTFHNGLCTEPLRYAHFLYNVNLYITYITRNTS
jgi:hypothetical protein